jgi:hypothetical protein
MNYPVIQLSKLRTALQHASENLGELPTEIDDWVSFRGEGQSVVDILSLLKGELDALGASEGFDSKFDAKARPIVHGYLANLDDHVLIDDDFWRYLSGIYLYDIVRARHPENAKSKSADSNWTNFGGKSTATTESLMRRLYIGASLSIDPGNRQDSYHLARIHDVDLWQSHIIRVLSGENPKYVKGLLKWFKERDKWYAKMPNSGPVLAELTKLDNFKTGHLRDFVKRVRRLRSNVIHEFLEQAEIDVMISQLAQESIEDRKSWGKKNVSKAKTKKAVTNRPKKKSATDRKRAKSTAVKKSSAKKKTSPKKKR